MIENILLLSFGILMLIAAFAVISLKNPIYSILCLIVVFFLAACLLILLDIEFLAMVLLIVYIGAIAILFLFIIMMIKLKGLEINLYESRFTFWHICGLLLFIFIVEFSFFIYHMDFASLNSADLDHYNNVSTLVNKLTNIESLGLLLYTYYFPIFLIASLILLIAMIGSIILILASKSNLKKQDLFEQQVRNCKTTLILKKYK